MSRVHWPPKPQYLRLVRDSCVELDTLETVRSPSDVARILRAEGAHHEVVECFWVLMLDAANQIRVIEQISRGILNATLVNPSCVFRLAIVHGAAGIIAVHNHPSGCTRPSPDDKSVTTKLVEAGRLLDVPLWDHIIIAGNSHFSFNEAGLI